jgi:nucleoid-associated protein EbfC
MKDMMSMMKQVQGLQTKMAEMQAELEAQTYIGTSAGGMVSVTLTGKGALNSLVIDESLMKPDEREILEDLIIAAHNDAKNKADTSTAEKMQSLTGGLPLPPGFKMPF